MFRKLAGIIAIATLCLTTASGVGAAETQKYAKPDATIEFSGGSAAIGIGFTWGSGEVKFKGKTYKFKISGLSAGEIGGTSVKAIGKVYNLKQIEDIEGTYLSGAAGGTLVGGGTRVTMKNDKEVQIKIETTAKGLSLKLAAEGVTITLKK
ncbi:EipA family protein [Propionivibrio sp.]|uniref:EipA family protein n=1 Tax=Propionivibrio sp. TaxID=2212460 RepID=UPI003BEFDB19